MHHAYAGKKIFHKTALIGEFTFPAKPLSFSKIFTMNSVIFILVFFSMNHNNTENIEKTLFECKTKDRVT